MANIVEKELGKKINHNTIKRLYNDNGIYAYNPIPKLLLIELVIKLRFEAAKGILFMSDEEIQRIIFTDESKFILFTRMKSFCLEGDIKWT